MPAQMNFSEYLDWLTNNQDFIAEMRRVNRTPPHPGSILWDDFLVPEKLSQNALAKKIGCTHAKVNEIIRGRRGISVYFALALEKIFPTVSAEYWLSLQTRYNLEQARTTLKRSRRQNHLP